MLRKNDTHSQTMPLCLVRVIPSKNTDCTHYIMFSGMIIDRRQCGLHRLLSQNTSTSKPDVLRQAPLFIVIAQRAAHYNEVEPRLTESYCVRDKYVVALPLAETHEQMTVVSRAGDLSPANTEQYLVMGDN